MVSYNNIWKSLSLRFKQLKKLKINKRIIKANIWRIIRTTLIVGLAFIVLYPLIFRFSSSIKSAADIADPTVLFVPKNPTFINFQTTMDAINYGNTFISSVLFCFMTSALQIISCILVAYGLARFKYWGNNIVFILVICTLIIPPQTLILPLYLRFKYFDIINLFKFTGGISGIDLTGTIIPFVLLSITANGFRNGLFIFLLRQYYKNLPYVLEEAAYIDGCGPFKTFYKIMLPGSVSMIVTVFLFSFVWQWNDNLYTSQLAPNLPLLTNKLLGLNFNTLGTLSDIYNASLMTPKFFLLVTPLIFLYIFAQRFFTESIERSGTVG